MSAPAAIGRNHRVLMIAITVALTALVAGANAHLVYVSLASQPDCVPHRRIGERQTGSAFAAAGSSCSPAHLTENPRSDR
ncbi:hypothetical protein [Rhizobium straminoryzae]|uniref:Uncharacterized protein n=1 Tax=Rhizobium straminoryzae TaxID=1387186 RepID=A0A549T647_9HYPH|nr:hypothetical protein [Rhizobium straminoryzae]TRL37344.1 hypothetical protein FNA46_15655 [Rhizobium straminoryzae]